MPGLPSTFSSKVVAQELYVITSAAMLFNSCSERGQEAVAKIEFIAESSTWAHESNDAQHSSRSRSTVSIQIKNTPTGPKMNANQI